MPVDIRKLAPIDVLEYKRLRLESLTNDPESFGSDYARESQFTDVEFLNRIEQRVLNFVMGLFDGDELVSTVGIYKTKAIINIWGVYTTPSHRGKGISKRLMLRIIELVTGADDVDRIRLGVTAQSAAAQALYKNVGFEVYIDEADTSCEILMELMLK